MKKYFWISLSVLFIFSFPTILEASSFVTARAAIVVDAQTGQILYRKNIHQPRPPASTTKIMTGILAIENANLSAQITASTKAAHEGGSSIYLSPGEKLTLEELVYGLLVKSGNDAAVAIAEYVGGSISNFSEMMNLKAKQIGALNTNFQNPNGLPQEGHLTTAYDLAQITRYALGNNFFAQVVSTPKKRIAWPGHSWDRILNNTNKLLTRSDIVNGVKTGYTRAAGRCLVSSATKGEREVISVVLKSNKLWQDSLNLLNYGLNQFKKKKIVKQGEIVDTVKIDKKRIDIKTASKFAWIIRKDRSFNLKQKIEYKTNITLPILAGEKVGNLAIYNQKDELVAKIDLLATEEIKLSSSSKFWQRVITQIQTYF